MAIYDGRTQDQFDFKGVFYQFHDDTLKPNPIARPGRPWPEIFQGGNSDDARENAAAVTNYYFMTGNTLEGFRVQMKDVIERAEKIGRTGQVKSAINSSVISRETETEAIRVLQEIQGKGDKDAVAAFAKQVKKAGSSTSNETGMVDCFHASADDAVGMRADLKFEDLVWYNDGFKTKLIGTPEQIADRILLLKSLGIDIVFLHYKDDIRQFGREAVLPQVRAEGREKDKGFEISLTGDVYRSRKREA